MHSITVFLLLTVLAFSSYVAAHGYLYYPPPRGIQKEAYEIDALKSPNRKGLCRGEPVGKITPVTAGGSVTLKFHITAPHVGPCVVYVLDANLQNPKKIAEKFNCAAPGNGDPWAIKLPTGLSGHKVLRWTWDGQHVSPSEPYEQCIDVNFGGSGKDEPAEYENGPADNDAPKPSDDDKPKGNKKPMENRRPPKMNKPEKVDTQVVEDDGVDTPYDSSEPSNDAPKDGDDYDNEKSDEADASEDCPTNGAYMCNGPKFAQCSNGKWVTFSCAPTTSCQETGSGGIVCAKSS